MEEDIKVLENFIRVYKELNEKSTDFYFNKAEIPIEIIENLIKGYKELQEKVNKYEKQIDLEWVEKNYIEKSKVREKMKQDTYTNEHTILGGRRNGKTLEYGIRLGRIQMCEELLKERDTNETKM